MTGEVGGEAGSAGGGAPGTSAREVFLSHASHDRAIATALAAHLEGAGIGCWMAPRDVLPGTLYADAIVRAINDARILVLVLSEHALLSAHVGKEVERASSKQRPIIALKIDAAPLSPAFEYFLSESQWIEVATGGQDAAFRNLAAAVRRLLTPGASAGRSDAARPGARPSLPEESARSRRRRERPTSVRLAIIGLVALIILLPQIRKMMRPPPPPTRPVAAEAMAAAASPSIAVLPFADMSASKDQEYFADGTAEEILDLLAKIPSLKVIARTSSFQFKGKSEDARSVAEKLGVATLLEGSVRKAGDRLRISTQLVRASDGKQLWSETFDRDVSDVFKTQDEIAGAVVAALKVSLLGRPVPKSTPTTNSEAYALYLRGRVLAHGYATADTHKARELLKQAVKLDPNFAPAWAMLAYSYWTDMVLGSVSQDMRGPLMDAAEKALALDPSLTSAHLSVGTVYWFLDRDFDAARREYAITRELDPGNADVLKVSAFVAISIGHLEEAVGFARSALDRDPLEVDNYRALGAALYFGGELAEAESVYRRALALNPAAEAIRFRLGLVLLSAGKPAEMREVIEQEPSAGWKRVGIALADHALGRTAEADRDLRSLLENSASWDYQIAQVYAQRRDRDKTFEWLAKAYDVHDPGLVNYIKADPLFTEFRADPRYAALLKKLRLPET